MIEFYKTTLIFDPVDRFLNVIPIFHTKFNARKDLFYKLSEIPTSGKKIATKYRQKPPVGKTASWQNRQLAEFRKVYETNLFKH